MTTMNGADALVRMLQLNGVKHIFGLCGDTSLPFYDALARLDHGMTTSSRATSAAPPTWPTPMRASRGKARRVRRARAAAARPTCCRAWSRRTNRPSRCWASPPTSRSASRGKYPLTELDQQALYRAADQVEHGASTASPRSRSAVRSRLRAMTTGRPGAAHIAPALRRAEAARSTRAEVWAQPGHDRYPA